jgi:histidinol-phosphate aminotransferase
MDKIRQLIRPHILDLKPYSSARDEYSGEEGIFLDANENPLGSTAGGSYNRYPDPYQRHLKERIAKIKKVSVENIFLGNGSDEAIDLVIRLFCQPERDNIIILPPTYGMYGVSANINNVTIKEIPLTQDFQINLKAVLSASDKRTKIIFVCTPNNPTGNLIEEKSILSLLEQFNGMVVVDEAYMDFVREKSMIRHLGKYRNLIVLQTFSKAWGMAGLRLGLAFALKGVIEYMSKIKYPYNINSCTQELALTALDNESTKNKMVKEIIAQRDLLVEKLKDLDIAEKIYPSDANFVLVKFEEPRKVYQYLLDEKIIVRDRSNVHLCDGCLRITVGTAWENEQLSECLKKYPVPQI